MNKKKIMVSGCYDLLHPGHVTFFNKAAEYGDLYVTVAKDETIYDLKKHKPLFSQEERLFMVKNIKSVKDCRIASGKGILDFEQDIDDIKPDIFIVNEDGDSEIKRKLIENKGIQYIITKRDIDKELKLRSSTSIKQETIELATNENKIEINYDKNLEKLKLIQNKTEYYNENIFPFRITLTGWFDQPWMSKIYKGSVIVINIYENNNFTSRSGLASSSRKVAQKLWNNQKPTHLNNIEAAKLLFGAENPPGTLEVSGSQDHIGIFSYGASKLNYDGLYWPNSIDNIIHEDIIDWLEDSITVVCLSQRDNNFSPLEIMYLSDEFIKACSDGCENIWESIMQKDVKKLGENLLLCRKAIQQMLPYTLPLELEKELRKYDESSYGGNFSGAGGGGVVVYATDKNKNLSSFSNAYKIKIRRESWLQ